MSGELLGFILGSTDIINDRLLLWLLAVVLLVMGLVTLLVLVSEVSRHRFMEHKERLTRGIWNDEKSVPEVDWEEQVSPVAATDSWHKQLRKSVN